MRRLPQKLTTKMSRYMQVAIKEALSNRDGGPFGAVITKGSNIISKAHNEVPKRNDPTAHAEILAIRKASAKLNTFDLSQCTLYTTCEPCPMCLGAIYWARLKKVYYGATRHDADKIGFDDKTFYREIRSPKILTQLEKNSCGDMMMKWRKTNDITY